MRLFEFAREGSAEVSANTLHAGCLLKGWLGSLKVITTQRDACFVPIPLLLDSPITEEGKADIARNVPGTP